jgi:hypothetical protein
MLSVPKCKNLGLGGLKNEKIIIFNTEVAK